MALKVVLVDWERYPLYRKKEIGENTIQCGLGRILKNMQKHSAGVQFQLLLVINCLDGKRKSVYENLLRKYDFISHVFFRNNLGQDIGAYNYGYRYLKQISYEGDVVFMNSSVVGPSHINWLLKYQKLFHQREDIGLCGISMNSHDTNIQENPPFAPHVQSFFLYSNMQLLNQVFQENLYGMDIDTSVKDGKKILIRDGEIGISRQILDAGYSICCIRNVDFFYNKKSLWLAPYGDLRPKRWFRKLANRV